MSDKNFFDSKNKHSFKSRTTFFNQLNFLLIEKPCFFKEKFNFNENQLIFLSKQKIFSGRKG